MPALFAFIANQNQNSIWQQPQHTFASLTDGFSPKLAAFSRAPGIFSLASSFFFSDEHIYTVTYLNLYNTAFVRLEEKTSDRQTFRQQKVLK